jgi:hypothetical protein
VITNIKRNALENVTFPAITICHWGSYKRDYYLNNTFVNTEIISIKSNKVSLIRNFFNNYSFFYSNNKPNYVKKELETFNIPDDYDCVRFNGFVTNKSIQLYKTNNTLDFFSATINNYYIENVSNSEYFKYSFISRYSYYPAFLYVFVAENYLKSIENIDFLRIILNNLNEIEIEKESIEMKLPEPYNQCKEFPIDKHYHQWNCIETCIYREIKNKYNCTYPLSLFEIPDLKQCDIPNKTMNTFQKEFSGCNKECPENCYSEKLSFSIRSNERGGYTDLKFSFRDLSTLNITQIPKIDAFTFINNIGGGLGLFMGIALPNLIEFIQFIFEISLIIIS